MHFARTPLSLALASVLSAAACAQDAANVVTVTAQGRTQQLQNVPIAVQVITNEQINKLGAPNLAGVSAYTPGLSVDAGQPAEPPARSRTEARGCCRSIKPGKSFARLEQIVMGLF